MTSTAPSVAAIVGAYEHPGRHLPEKSNADVVADVCVGAIGDAGVTLDSIDGFFFAGVHQGLAPAPMADHLGLDSLRHIDSTDLGGASAVAQIGHAAEAIRAGKCSVALVAMGGTPRSAVPSVKPVDAALRHQAPAGLGQVPAYALAARRHMAIHGTTGRHLAAVKVTASEHAQHNPHARLAHRVTIEEVLDSPMISDPLHRLDCCVTTDGGGAVVVATREVAEDLGAEVAWVRGWGETIRTTKGGRVDLLSTGAERSGPCAFEMAGLQRRDIGYASLYDSFTITVLLELESLGFCEEGQAGRFVEDGGLAAPHGRLPFNTDGGGLCNNHPDRRGGMARTLEAVRQIRGSAHPELQVRDCNHALVHAVGHSLATTASGATLILGREPA